MIRQWFSTITQDDNPRLHRTPFLLLWVASYSLAWLSIYIYEHKLSGWLCDFVGWWTRWDADWREGVFIGLLVGLILSIMQTWLLRRRYGFVPRYWWIATLVGATIGGFGYFPLARIRIPLLIDKFLIWFIVINSFQTIAIFRTNRRAWWIASVGIMSACTAIPIGLQSSRIIAVVLATAVQAIGTGVVISYLMEHPRQGIKPKRDDSQKPKHGLQNNMHPLTFTVLWITIFYIAYSGAILADKLPILYLIRGNESIRHLVTSSHIPIHFLTLGIITGIAQQWLIKCYCGQKIRYWRWFTLAGWLSVGLIWFLVSNNDIFTDIEGKVLAGIWFVFPVLFQTILMIRTMQDGWIWIITGLATGLIVSSLYEVRYPMYFPRDQLAHAIIGGFILSFITAVVFLWLVSHQDQTQSESNLHN
jgi:hypothetical protein